MTPMDVIGWSLAALMCMAVIFIGFSLFANVYDWCKGRKK